MTDQAKAVLSKLCAFESPFDDVADEDRAATYDALHELEAAGFARYAERGAWLVTEAGRSEMSKPTTKLKAADFYALCDAVTYRVDSISSAVGPTEIRRELDGLEVRLAELNAAEPKRMNPGLARAWTSAIAKGEEGLRSARSRLARHNPVVAVDDTDVAA